MKFYVHDSDVPEDGTLLREEPGQVPEILHRATLQWTESRVYFGATQMTSDWNEITEEESRRIEAHQRVLATA